MLVKSADVEFPMIVDEVIKPGLRQNIEREILSLAVSEGVGAIDKPGPNPARSIGLQTPSRPDKDMSKAHRDPEIVIFGAAKNRLDHAGEVNLIVAAKYTVVVAVYSPPDAAGKKLRANFIGVGVADKAEQISTLGCELETRRVKRFKRRQIQLGARFWFTSAGLAPGEAGDTEKQREDISRESHQRAKTIFRVPAIAIKGRHGHAAVMKNLFVFGVFVAGLLGTESLQATEDNAASLADAVWKASGGENWPQVKTIDFTFVVEKEGKPVVSAEHHWDVGAMTDRVKWKGRDVTVNLVTPAQLRMRKMLTPAG